MFVFAFLITADTSGETCDVGNNEDDDECSSQTGLKVIFATVRGSGSSKSHAEFQAVIQAMSNLFILSSYIRPLSVKLMNDVIRPCVTSPRSRKIVVDVIGSKVSLDVRNIAAGELDKDELTFREDALKALKNVQVILTDSETFPHHLQIIKKQFVNFLIFCLASW